jgi:hypothetical protein
MTKKWGTSVFPKPLPYIWGCGLPQPHEKDDGRIKVDKNRQRNTLDCGAVGCLGPGENKTDKQRERKKLNIRSRRKKKISEKLQGKLKIKEGEEGEGGNSYSEGTS